jgi:hypothetical protein
VHSSFAEVKGRFLAAAQADFGAESPLRWPFLNWFEAISQRLALIRTPQTALPKGAHAQKVVGGRKDLQAPGQRRLCRVEARHVLFGRTHTLSRLTGTAAGSAQPDSLKLQLG